MKKDYQAIITEKMLPQTDYSFTTFIQKHTAVNPLGSTMSHYLRAWHDLIAQSKLKKL